jgi:hypothetical protein
MKEAVLTDPVIPIRFGSEKKGMQTGAEIDNPEEARDIWQRARDAAVDYADMLAELGVHKSICNRLTEPWMWITVVMTATEWNNFFRLRCHPDAEIHFQKIAGMLKETLEGNVPEFLREGDWHRPYFDAEDAGRLRAAGYHNDGFRDAANRISAARCARVSYLTQNGIRDIEDDLEFYEKLTTGSGFGHWSPMEHVAMALAQAERHGPFYGWKQLRKFYPLENSEG